jgi:hypothetical protein
LTSTSAPPSASPFIAVDGERWQLVELAEFPPESMDGNEGKLPAKIAALAGCAAVYCLAAGGSAVKQLLAAGVQPVRLDDEAPHRTLLKQVSRHPRRRHPLGGQGAVEGRRRRTLLADGRRGLAGMTGTQANESPYGETP